MLRWRRLDLGNVVQAVNETVQDPTSLLHMRQLPAPEDDRDRDLVLMLEELTRVVDLEVNIVLAGLGANTYFLSATVMGVCPVLILPLLLLVLELAMIHNPADRGPLRRGHFNQVQAGIACNFNRFFRG